MYEEITRQARAAAEELMDVAGMKPGQLLVVGCSTSEIEGYNPGTHSAEELGRAVLAGIYPAARERGVFLAAQCCEHLNRAVILEREAQEKFGLEEVNVVPQPKAGGSFATALYAALEDPVAVEGVKAHAGMDIGGVLIGMQLRPVAVPVRLQTRKIGEAILLCARTRAKFIGGERARYK